MLIIIVVSLLVFAGTFYLTRLIYPVAENQAVLIHKRKMQKISPRLDRMFLDISLKRLILLDITLPLACALIGFMIKREIWFVLSCGAVGFFVPFIILKYLEAQRRRKFLAQLIDAMMIISSSLKVGMSLQQAFEVLVQEMPPPVSQEFGLVLRQVHMGYNLEDALEDLRRRMRLDELDMVVTSLLVAKDTGGDITETLSKVSFTIQERNKLIGKVKALTVQAKLQGIIMSLIPIAFGLFIYQSDPNFFNAFFQDQYGRMIFAYAIVSQILGMFFIIKFSKVDI